MKICLAIALSLSMFAAGCAEEVAVGPPPAQVEVVPPAPYVGAAWTGGYWAWRGGRHVWIPGRYVAARPGRVWVPHTWVRGPHGRRHMVPGSGVSDGRDRLRWGRGARGGTRTRTTLSARGF